MQRHPVLQQTLIWAMPALLVGALLRLALIHSLPYAFWGADSRSYFSFAHLLIVRHVVSLVEKRRYLYPISLLPVALLPGTPLRWLAILQHALGLVSVAPIGYIVRRTMTHWRLWIIPTTAVYAAMPVMVWYEHELLGENLFFAALTWAIGGWVAWMQTKSPERARGIFWWFFVPLAIFMLTKPSGRFVWPGLVMGIMVTGGWRKLGRWQCAALAALAVATLTVGSRKQGAWLLYTATFPLTQLETAPHREYKVEIADLVEPLNRQIDTYYLQDGGPFEFLERPGLQESRPLWQALEGDSAKKEQLYMALAIEGIKARPLTFVYLGWQRLIASANLSEFRRDRFTGDYFRQRTEHFYAEAERDEKSPVRLAFGFAQREAIPPYAEFEKRLEPNPGGWILATAQRVLGWVGDAIDFVKMPRGHREDRSILLARPTVLGWWLTIAVVVAFSGRYWRTHGVWILAAGTYLLGVFVVSQRNPRYFAVAWPILIPLLALPADAIVRGVVTAARRLRNSRRSQPRAVAEQPS